MMLRHLTVLFLAIPCQVQSEDIYRASFSENLEEVSVEACFDGSAPEQLFRNEDAAAFASGIKFNQREIKSPSRSWRVKLPDLPQNACLQWSVDLAAAAASSDYRLAMKIDGGYLTSGNLWFWRDGDRRPLLIQVDLPGERSISAPWHLVEARPAKLTFKPQPTPVSWSSRIAIGQFPVVEVALPGTRLRVATIGTTTQQSTNLAGWIQSTAESIALVSGNFPRSDAQILIIAIGPRDGPVPWAHVLRGGGIAAEFFVDETRPIDEFTRDWKATHELSHMLLPYVSSKDRWLSEGLATYYENVLRSRQGSITEEQAWLNLHNGFERGRAASNGESLARATRSGRAATMRVYWSGAAMMLKADAQIRTQSGGNQTLDHTLSELQNCCLEQSKTWSARELFARMDQLNGNRVFMSLYEEHVNATEFPDLGAVYEQLGLVIDSDSVTMNNDAHGRDIRYFIMNPNPDGKMLEPPPHSSGGK